MKPIDLVKRFSGLTATLLLGLSFSNCNGGTPSIVGGPSDFGGAGKGGTGKGGTPGGAGAGGSASPFSGQLIHLDAAVSSGNGGANGTGGAAVAPTGDANCGVQTSSTTLQPTDVLLLLDRSGSMSWSIDDDCCCTSTCTSSAATCLSTASCTVRWPTLISAINTTMLQATGINWGLKLFPSQPPSGVPLALTDPCAVNPGVEVNIGAGSATTLQTQIASGSTSGGTPTASAITTVTQYMRTLSDTNTKVILLATDGKANCQVGSDDTTASDVDNAVVAIKAAFAAGFKVHVIGIGPSVGNLDNFAKAGGTDHYYPASSAKDLVSALATISKAVASCTFAMSQTPPDPNNLAVYLNGKLVSKDDANGWGFGSSSQTVVLNGTTCNQITSAPTSKVQVLFGCPGQQPPPEIIF
jgi:hypothetical protein